MELNFKEIKEISFEIDQLSKFIIIFGSRITGKPIQVVIFLNRLLKVREMLKKL